MKSEYPLQWPEGRPRTMLDRMEDKKIWKLTTLQYRAEIVKELERVNARGVVVSCNMPHDLMGKKTPEPRDCGVAVYFSRPPAEEDFRWQEVLGITKPDPTVAEIEDAYRPLARIYHPDAGGDRDLFEKLCEAKKRAISWVTGDYGKEHAMVIECDKYRAVRWNMKAIAITLHSIRRIEESGASSLFERALEGFRAELPETLHASA